MTPRSESWIKKTIALRMQTSVLQTVLFSLNNGDVFASLLVLISSPVDADV